LSGLRVPSSIARTDRTPPAGSAAPSRVTLATSLRRSSTRSHWIADSSETPLMKAVTSAWLGPYGAGAFATEAGATRPRGGLVMVLIALVTAERTGSAAGTCSSAWLRDESEL